MLQMQRYWGSDDENSSELDGSNNKESGHAQKQEPIEDKQKLIHRGFVKEIDEGIDLSYSNCKDNQLQNSEEDISLRENTRKYNKDAKDIDIRKNSFGTNNDKQNLEYRAKSAGSKKVKKHKRKLSSSNDAINVKVRGGISNSDIDTETSLPNFKKLKTEQSKKTLKKGNECKVDLQKTDEILSNRELNFCPIGEIKKKDDKKIEHILPKWLSNPILIGIDLQEKETPLSELEYLDNTTKKNLENAGIKCLFPVQHAVIPWLTQNKRNIAVQPSDLCVSAPTGSGKTLAFVIPIVQALKSRVICAIRALVVLPVRELANQVYKVFEKLAKGTDLKIILLTGQKSFLAEQEALVETRMCKTRSLVDIIIATPGRLLDHIHRTDGFCLQRLRYLVIDEADRMMEEFEQGWLKQIEDAVYKDSQKSTCFCNSLDFRRVSIKPATACQFSCITQPLQKLLYSATLTHNPEKLHSLSLYRPKLFTGKAGSTEKVSKCLLPESLTVLHTICDESTKPMVLCHLLKELGFKKVLCFTNSAERAQRLHIVLEEMGILQVREISSCNRHVQRKIVLGQFNSGKINVLVCSDIVARGMDIEDIDCVISYDVPQFVKTYIHRMGRTARAGKSGTGITLVSNSEFKSFKKMLRHAGLSLPEQVTVSTENLKDYVNPFKTALKVTDAKLRKRKANAHLMKRIGKKRLAKRN